jgi:hypothetical protein
MSFLGNLLSAKSDNKIVTPTLGVNISASEGFKTELASVTNKLRTTNKRYTDEIAKYREIAEFNKKLSVSYMQNVQAMVDVSQLLEQYAGIFNVLKEETDKLEQALGMQLNIQDFQYLENMTKDKMAELNDKFFKESETLKKLYTQYGKEHEASNIVAAQTLMNQSLANASSTYKKLTTLDQHQKLGGASSRHALKTTVRKLVNGQKSVKKVDGFGRGKKKEGSKTKVPK